MMDAAIFQYASQFRRKQLEGIMTDCARVYALVMSNGTILKNNENEIRDKLAEYLEDDDYKANCTLTVKNFQVDHEVPEGPHGRADIRFLPVNPYEGQKAYFIFECKRLDGSHHLNNEYVEHGIKRFKTTDKYSTLLGVNGMLGFLVKPLDVVATCRDINTHLTIDEQLIAVTGNVIPGCYDFESSLNAPSGMITLLHLWMDFSSSMKLVEPYAE
jgi:hypothetical protein